MNRPADDIADDSGAAAPAKKRGGLVVISGPSGAGKSTIVARVIKRIGAGYSVSVTTRRPRPGEVDGREYRFVDRAEFNRMMDSGELLEWAEVFGRLYGTPAAPVADAINAGKTMVLDVDVRGAVAVARRMPGAVFILIVPPNRDELAVRLRGRGSEDEASVRLRLDKADEEIRAARQSGLYNHEIVNDDLDRAVERTVEAISQELERT